MKFSIGISLVATLSIASISSVAAADVLVSNMDGGSDFTALTVGGGSTTLDASRFVTGTDPSTVTGASATMYNGGSFGLATYQAMIFADAGGSPGSVVATFDTQPTLPDGTSYTLVNFADVGISLDANTSYWFGVRNLTGQAIGLRTTYSDSETSGFGWTIDDNDVEYTTNLGASWTDSSGLYGGRVLRFAIEGATVPTPGALALVGLGGLVIAGRRR